MSSESTGNHVRHVAAVDGSLRATRETRGPDGKTGLNLGNRFGRLLEITGGVSRALLLAGAVASAGCVLKSAGTGEGCNEDLFDCDKITSTVGTGAGGHSGGTEGNAGNGSGGKGGEISSGGAGTGGNEVGGTGGTGVNGKGGAGGGNGGFDAGSDAAPDANPVDAGETDANPVDAGGPDANPVDAGGPDANPVDAGGPDASPPCEAGMLNTIVNSPTTFEALWLRPDPNDPSIFEVKNTTPFLGGGAIDTQNGILLADQGALEADIAMVQVKDNPVVNPGDPSSKFVTVNTTACTVSCEVIVLNQITALPLNGPGGYLDYASKPAIDYVALPDSDQKNNVFYGGYSLGAANATSNLYRCRITK